MAMQKVSCYSFFFGTQLFGRAGRGGFLCRAVLLTDARELQRCKDVGLVEFCTAKENCRRKHMLRALGSDEPVQTVNGQMCCDVCSQQCSNKGSSRPSAVSGSSPSQSS